eukprot:CAMPEP_0180402682 /NCGR_PEP_ID=MMETSP0989-20121125/38995_1 /TAXON_ID=697907 /ORGANISM="non described non described, Strain CCMP2293" /LENGTH=298 /DNA_ID=CAMNT_0022405813 /DNA_START=41 /DNA_END=934 /DNA_ORIENTATION=+
MFSLALDHPACCGFNSPEEGVVWAAVPLAAGLVLQLLAQLCYAANCSVPLQSEESHSVLGWGAKPASESDRMLRRAVMNSGRLLRSALHTALLLLALTFLLLKSSAPLFLPASHTVASIPLLAFFGVVLIPAVMRLLSPLISDTPLVPERPPLAHTAAPASNPLKDGMIAIDAACLATISVLVTQTLDLERGAIWPSAVLIPALTPAVVASLLLILAVAAGVTTLCRSKPKEHLSIQGSGAPLSLGLRWLEPVEWYPSGEDDAESIHPEYAEKQPRVCITWACPEWRDEGGACNLYSL